MFDKSVKRMKYSNESSFSYVRNGEQKKLKSLSLGRNYMVKPIGSFGLVWDESEQYIGEYNLNRFSGAKEAQ